MARRYQVFLTYLAVLTVAWLVCITIKNAVLLSPAIDILITFAPVLGILGLGVFLLSRLIIGVLAFKDCPDAAKEIDGQILEAKAEMRRRNIIGVAKLDDSCDSITEIDGLLDAKADMKRRNVVGKRE